MAAPAVAQTQPASFAYVSNRLSNYVTVVNTATNKVTDTIDLDASGGAGARGVAASMDAIYVTTGGPTPSSDDVSVIDPSTNTVTATIPVGTGARGVAADPVDGGNAFVASEGSNTVSVIDPATNVATVPVGKAPGEVAFSPDGTRVYVTNQQDGTATVMDPSTNTRIGTLDVGSHPWGIAIKPSTLDS
ncbi:YncE family protein [Streptomyces sp. NPDC127178]|uniref:YncE family protein n=1 Tax=unclassified Streptomyces TaxID=2593676 RepID=UPI003624D105